MELPRSSTALVMAEPAAAATPIWVAAGASASVSAAQTVAIALAGGILARTKLRGGRASIRDITQYTVWFFCPCLTISRLAETLTLDRLLQLWLLPTFSIIIVVMGALIGATVCSLLAVEKKHMPVVICCCACGTSNFY